MTTTRTNPASQNELMPGDRIRFTPAAGAGRRWWTVRATDERYLVATCPLHDDELVYNVVDFTGWTRTYNGVPPGVVRSSLDTLGGGYDVGEDGENCRQILAKLRDGTCQLSHRRLTPVSEIRRKRARSRTSPKGAVRNG